MLQLFVSKAILGQAVLNHSRNFTFHFEALISKQIKVFEQRDDSNALRKEGAFEFYRTNAKRRKEKLQLKNPTDLYYYQCIDLSAMSLESEDPSTAGNMYYIAA